MPSKRVRGFTLVELLVVIAIIGTLVALLLPAVSRARESSRRSSCLNNLRQLALGTTHYEDRFRKFPGLFESFTSNRFTTNPMVVTTTWPVLLLPEIERQQVFDLYAAGQMPNTYVQGFVCPSDALKTREGAETSYVANGGRLASATADKIANGPFVNKILHPDMSTLEGHWVDGREYTLIYSENINASYYDDEGWNSWAMADTKIDSDFLGRERTWNPVFLWVSNPDERVYINASGADLSNVTGCKGGIRRYETDDCGEGEGKAMATWARPASYHSGGVNVAFASSRVVFLRENIDYQVYIALMTLNEKHSDSPNRSFMLEDKHYQ